jgi:hypothetical protein
MVVRSRRCGHAASLFGDELTEPASAGSKVIEIVCRWRVIVLTIEKIVPLRQSVPSRRTPAPATGRNLHPTQLIHCYAARADILLRLVRNLAGG